MGTKETVKWITLTYLTIDRLVRGSVEVKQLHGPVGILDVGAKTAAQGLTYCCSSWAFVGQLGRVELPPFARG